MPILTRKNGEAIVIGSNIHAVVVAVQGDKVRIGISAPKETVVGRQDIAEKRNLWFNEHLAIATDLPATRIRTVASAPL